MEKVPPVLIFPALLFFAHLEESSFSTLFPPGLIPAQTTERGFLLLDWLFARAVFNHEPLSESGFWRTCTGTIPLTVGSIIRSSSFRVGRILEDPLLSLVILCHWAWFFFFFKYIYTSFSNVSRQYTRCGVLSHVTIVTFWQSFVFRV
jgi:hypothetical protein